MRSKYFQRYLIACGIGMNLLLGCTAYYYSQSLFEFSSLPIALTSMASKLGQYSSLQSISHSLDEFANSLEEPDYYWKTFDPALWPTVGPAIQSIPLSATTRKIYVENGEELTENLKNAKPGDTIIVADGEYHLKSKRFPVSSETASAEHPITLVAAHSGKAKLLMQSLEGLYLDRPYWTIAGFIFVGKCGNSSSCEHAIHVVGNAHHTTIEQNEFIDFNAAIKVNRYNQFFPDDGLVKSNHFHFTKPRNTTSPVTPINIDHANNWVVSHNIIRDFIKTGGNRISYGAFMKGGANNGVFENNLVICNSSSKPARGATVGLSVGGGGMKDRRDDVAYQANNTRIRNNIIFHCSDVGIYVNGGQNSLINNNTLYNTLGIDVRFPESSAVVVNNLFSGDLRERDKGKVLINFGNIIYSRGFIHNDDQLSAVFSSPGIGDFKITDRDLDIHNNALPYPLERSRNISDFCGSPIHVGDKFTGAFNNETGCFHTQNVSAP